MTKIKFLARKFLFQIFILHLLFQSAQPFYEKREGSGSIAAFVTSAGSIDEAR
jgi:hypothetical protein